MGQRERMIVEDGLSSASDLELVSGVLRKDRKATAEFVARHADCLYAYVRGRLMPRTEATDDLVQEVFLAAWQGLSHYRGESSLRQWLMGIARHKIEDYYRKRLRQADWPESEDEPAHEPSILPVFEEEVDRILAREKVRRIIATLPETYGLALLWRYLEDRSVREMAQLTGKTEKAVERLLARAREAFRRSWNHARQ